MTIPQSAVEQMIRKLLNAQDYRAVILPLINSDFVSYAMGFFKRIAMTKVEGGVITREWYQQHFVTDPALSRQEIIIQSGLNEKTISNAYGTARKDVVIQAAAANLDVLYRLIDDLIQQGEGLDVELTIRFNDVSVHLHLSETLLVVNVLAVKRAQIRGGAWSSAGKRVEKYLMLTLCELYGVSPENYALTGLSGQQREVDFFLISDTGKSLCEVKLMGKGNPESADAVIARDTKVFVADKLSALNKQQLTQRDIHWVELRTPNGYRRFFDVLHALKVPCGDFEGDLNARLDAIFPTLLTDEDA